jgi:hypothetical protein
VTEALPHDLFVSHGPADGAWVRGYLLPALGLAPERVITSGDFRLGAAAVTEFERAVTSSRYTLLVLTPSYLADEWAIFGEQLTSHASVAAGRDRLIPLVLQPCELPLRIDFRVQRDCTDEAEWDGATARLRQLLAQPEPAPVHIPCPYPGMVPFRAEDARFFYGREAEIEQMFQHLRHQRCLFAIGPSGSGKSSLVSAGLLPRLTGSSYFHPGFWLTRQMRPGSRPMQILTELLGHQPDKPDQAVAHLLAACPPAQRLLLVIDQFEELFTQAERAEQSCFMAALKALRALENCAVLVTMRADFYPDLMNSDLWPVDHSQRLEIAPLRGEALRQAVQQPAADVGVYLEPGLLERLLADAADEPGVLPLVQEIMVLLWDKKARHLIPLRAYEELGRDVGSGLAAAVATKADATLAELTPQQQQIARHVFLSLVQFGEAGPDTRRQQVLADLCRAGDDPGDFHRTVEHLTSHRLLICSSEDDARGPVVDLSHEVLISGWPRLRMWLYEDRASLLLQRRLQQAADEWRTQGRDPSCLYGGTRLDEAKRFAAHNPQELSEDENEFLAASDAREAIRERTRYLGQAAGGAVGAALGYSCAFALGFWSARGDLSVLSVIFLAMFPVGQLVGFSIGIALWLCRHDRARQAAAAGLIGAFTSSATYPLFLLFVTPGGVDFRHVATGAFLGAGLGLGAGLSSTKQRRLAGTTVGGLLGALLAVATGGVLWNPLVTAISGLMLGGLTGAGFRATGVEGDERLIG